jgi:rod shape-determining protein MreC
MKQLLDILFLFKEYVLLALYLVLSILLLALNDTHQIRMIRSITIVAVGALQDAVSFIPKYFDLGRENRALREMNIMLADEVNRLREARLENIRLRQMLGFREQSAFTYTSASVIGKNLQLLRNTITLDVGDDDGVKVDMPIVTDAGLVGRISATSARYSIGQILLNRDLRVSARVQRTRVDGIIMWEGGDHLVLRNVARTLDVLEGDAVITSEYSSVFPPGIKVGVVRKTSEAPGALFQTIEVVPGVDFTRLEEVFIVRTVPDSARVAIEQRVPR